MRRVVSGLAVIGLGLWFAAGALLCENGLRVQRAAPGATPGDVEITAADGAILHGSFLRGRGERGCVLLMHGITDARSGTLGIAPMFLETGYSVLAPDSRAHGLSGGAMNTFGLLERGDTLRWAAWLRQQGCRRLYGLGESLGASVLIQAAAREPVFAAIVAECPFRDLPAIAEYRVAQKVPAPRPLARLVAGTVMPAALLYAHFRYGFDLAEASPVKSARGLKTPLLLIHGTADTNIPPEHSLAIAAADPKAVLWLVPGARHTGASATAAGEFRRRVLAWFDRH